MSGVNEPVAIFTFDAFSLRLVIHLHRVQFAVVFLQLARKNKNRQIVKSSSLVHSIVFVPHLWQNGLVEKLLGSAARELQQWQHFRLNQWLDQHHNLIDDRRCVHDVDFLQTRWMCLLNVRHEWAQWAQLDACQMAQANAFHVKHHDIALGKIIFAQANVVEHAKCLQAITEYHLRWIVVDQTVQQDMIAFRCGLRHCRHLAVIHTKEIKRLFSLTINVVLDLPQTKHILHAVQQRITIAEDLLSAGAYSRVLLQRTLRSRFVPITCVQEEYGMIFRVTWQPWLLLNPTIQKKNNKQ